MKHITAKYIISGIMGKCGSKEVFLGFAPARILYHYSFADVLNEDTCTGYQRPINRGHSKSFSKYIAIPGTSTIPLTFNLRPDLSKNWLLKRKIGGISFLVLKSDCPCLAQVDCQHRLGEMADSDIPFAFMAFVGLDLRSEMALFNVINSKAKGLSSSLTDFHQTRLIDDLAKEAPHLLIAKQLNEDQESPWFKMVRYGGESTSGLKRRTSFRMLQITCRRVLKHMQQVGIDDVESQYNIILEYWKAIQQVFPKEWNDYRHTLLSKGIGLYSLMELLCDFIADSDKNNLNVNWFISKLKLLISSIDWNSRGMFANAGGRKGAHEVYQILKKVIFK